MTKKRKPIVTLYICDGCKESCKKDPFNICYKNPNNINYLYDNACYHTSDINHSLIEKAKQININIDTIFIEEDFGDKILKVEKLNV